MKNFAVNAWYRSFGGGRINVGMRANLTRTSHTTTTARKNSTGSAISLRDSFKLVLGRRMSKELKGNPFSCQGSSLDGAHEERVAGHMLSAIDKRQGSD